MEYVIVNDRRMITTFGAILCVALLLGAMCKCRRELTI